LRNLVSNALKFTFSGKKVEVLARGKEDFVEVEVKDQGVGMDKKAVETLFDPERKIKSNGTNNEKGTGLGLFIVKEFVEKSGGTIRVKSKPEKGSSFILTLPSKQR
jgi:signal transduction histidine kinase